jgi:hypothetical protein
MMPESDMHQLLRRRRRGLAGVAARKGRAPAGRIRSRRVARASVPPGMAVIT